MRRVQQVRENALTLAVEKEAKHILKEKKEAKREKGYKQYLKEEAEDMKIKHAELHEKRAETLSTVLTNE